MRASQVSPRAVEWLWKPYFPLGKVSVVAGQMGQAKSLFTTWLAADTTPHGVVMLSAEDDPADTIRPRLEAAQTDLYAVEISSEATLNATALNKLCDEVGDVRLITVDPISAYLPASVNSWKGQDVRLALEPIRQLAAERSIAVVLVQHINRRADNEPLARIADSQGVPQLARSVMIWGPDPSDPAGDHGTAKVLTRVKGNLAPSSKASATFTITERTVTGNLTVPVLVRGADAEITPDDVIADHETRTARDEAAEWLRALLAPGPVPAKDALRQARDIGLSERTVRRAKATLSVVSEPSKDDDHLVSGWVWRLPDNHSYIPGKVGKVGNLDPHGPDGPDGPDCQPHLLTTFEAD